MDHRGRFKAEVDANDIVGLRNWTRQHDLAFPLYGERDEPTIGSPRDRGREDPPLEPALACRLLQPDAADHRQADVPLSQPNFVDTTRIALALPLEAWKAGLRPLALQTLQEAVEGMLEIDERLLADVGGDLVEPRTIALLQLHEGPLQLGQAPTLPRRLVHALRLGQPPSCRRSASLRRSSRAAPAASGSDQARTEKLAESNTSHQANACSHDSGEPG